MKLENRNLKLDTGKAKNRKQISNFKFHVSNVLEVKR